MEQSLEIRIRELAYQIYLERQQNNIQGDSSSDWEKAYSMIMNSQNVSTDANTWSKN